MLEFGLILSFSLILISAFCNHPLTLCLTLIALALSISTVSGLMFSKWIFYAVILIFLGGMMVVFSYVTALAGNEKFNMDSIPLALSFFVFMAAYMHSFFSKLTLFKKEIFMSHFYFSSTCSLLTFMIIFLLSTLIVVIKLAENFKGTLVKFL